MLDPDSTVPIIVLLTLFLLHASFAAFKQAITSIRKSRRLQLIEQDHIAAKRIDALAEDIPLTFTTEQLALKLITSTIIVFAIIVYAEPLAQAVSVSSFTAAFTIVTVFILPILILTEVIAKEVATKFAEPIALWAVYPFSWLSYVAAPLAKIAVFTSRLLSGRWDERDSETGNLTITEEDLLSYVDVGEEEGVLKEDEKAMIYSIIDLDDTVAREVMIPRIDIVAVEHNTSIEEAIDIAMQAGHSRLPVYAETIDNILGVLYVKDLLVYWHADTFPKSVAGLERQVYFVPETKPASELLRELQSKKVHIAIVVDEYGGTAGLVTIEDILEEIVGEIQDEHDADEFYMQYVSDNEYIFNARISLDDVNSLMSLELPTNESDTLGGLIYNALGRVPTAGDSLSGESLGFPDLYFTVLDVDGRRIQTVKIYRTDSQNIGTSQEYNVSISQNSSSLLNNSHQSFSESS